MEEATILTDEKIDELLAQAETRLRAKATGTLEGELLLASDGTASKSRKPYVYPLLCGNLDLTMSIDFPSCDMVLRDRPISKTIKVSQKLTQRPRSHRSRPRMQEDGGLLDCLKTRRKSYVLLYC
jgi:hypothetical protein